MNGREIERLLTAIDDEMRSSRRSDEVLSYFRDHQEAVLASLRDKCQVSVPTSMGNVEIHLRDLEALVA